jgi:hypothetical protein
VIKLKNRRRVWRLLVHGTSITRYTTIRGLQMNWLWPIPD